MTASTPPLRLLRLELLRRCPLACIHCSAEAGPARSEAMPLQQVGALLADGVELGAHELVLTGGEPLDYPELNQCLSCARRLGFKTTLFTTGISSRAGIAHADFDLLTAIKGLTDTFVFSLYSHRPELHDQITATPGSWANTLKAAEHVAHLGSLVNFTFLPITQNYQDLPDVASIVRNVGAGELRVIKLFAHGRAARNPRLAAPDPSAIASLISRAKAVAHPTRVRVGGAAAVYGPDTSCEAPTSEIFVGVAGWISPCPSYSPTQSDANSNCFAVGLRRVWERSKLLHAVRQARAQGSDCVDGCVVVRALNS